MIFCTTLPFFVTQAVLFSVEEADPCPDHSPFYQCVDYLVVKSPFDRRPYYFFTMFMSFILPMIVTVVSYSLVVYEITNMMRRDRGNFMSYNLLFVYSNLIHIFLKLEIMILHSYDGKTKFKHRQHHAGSKKNHVYDVIGDVNVRYFMGTLLRYRYRVLDQ